MFSIRIGLGLLMASLDQPVLDNPDPRRVYITNGGHYGIVAVEQVLQVVSTPESYPDKADPGFAGSLSAGFIR